MYWHVCLHAISKPSYEVGYIGLWTHMPILILFTWGLFTHMLFLKLATLWHDSVILFTFYFWTGYMGVTEPSYIWRCTHLDAMCIHIPISQSNWKLHACDHTHAYQHRTVRNTCNCWHVTIFGNCIYDISIYDYTQNLCACDKYIYINILSHKKLHVPIHVCTHTEGEHAQKQHVFEHVWIWQHVTMLWNCICVNMWVHAKICPFLEISCYNVCLCQNMTMFENCMLVKMCTHIYTQTHTNMWLYLKNVCM